MPVVRSSVVVAAPLDATFEVSNRLEHWPRMMKEYERVEIFREEGAKRWFRLSHENGTSWISWRLVHRDGLFALAERCDPRAPFAFMQHLWTYQSRERGTTEMTWTMTFELPASVRDREETVARHLAESTRANQARMAAYIEGAS